MNAQNIVRYLAILIIMGMTMFPALHLDAEKTENKAETTEDVKETVVPVEVVEKSETVVGMTEKLETVLETIMESVKEIEKLSSDINLDKEKMDVEKLTKQIKEKISRLNDIDGVTVKVIDASELSESANPYEELEEKIKELAKNEALTPDELAKKIVHQVKEMKSDPTFILDKDNIKVLKYGPYVTTKTWTGPKEIKDLEDKIKELAKDKDLNADALKKKLRTLVENMKADIEVITDFSNEGVKVIQLDPSHLFNYDFIDPPVGVKVIQLDPSQASKKDNSAYIQKLEKRIDKLETKLDKIIEKLGQSDPKPSESE